MKLGNVPSYHYLTEVDFTEVIEPYGYLLLINIGLSITSELNETL